MLALESETQDSSMSTNQTRLSQGAPLTRTTRPIRNIVREAFKAIRGAERVQMLEKLRSAWCVELPSGKAFKGITAAQLAWKEKNSGKEGKRVQHRKKTRMAAADIASLGVHGGSGHGSQVTEVTAVTGTNYDDDTVTNTSSRSRTNIEEEDEDEEDIMFRVIAQRVEPSVSSLFRKEERGGCRGSSARLMGSSSAVNGNVVDFQSSVSNGDVSGGVMSIPAIASSSASRSASRSPTIRSNSRPGNSLTNLFDVKSVLGSSASGMVLGGGGSSAGGGYHDSSKSSTSQHALY